MELMRGRDGIEDEGEMELRRGRDRMEEKRSENAAEGLRE